MNPTDAALLDFQFPALGCLVCGCDILQAPLKQPSAGSCESCRAVGSVSRFHPCTDVKRLDAIRKSGITGLSFFKCAKQD